MQTSLFPSESVIKKNQIVQPLTQILEEAPPKSPSEQIQNKNNSQSIKQSLDELFPEQQLEEKNLKKTKQILGALAEECTEEELQDVVAKTQYLCENWLDAFERSIFGERTLQELLHEKGGT